MAPKIAAIMASSFLLGITTCLAQQAVFTQQQVTHGRLLYNLHCSECHGSTLSGQSGPALAGSEFRDSLELSGMSAKQLYNYVSTQMPFGSPGSLSEEQYLEILAYMLSKNGYEAKHQKLTEQTLSSVELLPYPGRGASAGDQERNSPR